MGSETNSAPAQALRLANSEAPAISNALTKILMANRIHLLGTG